MSIETVKGHSWEGLNPQDCYNHDDDWRIQQPFGTYKGEFPDSQDGDLEKSGPSKAEFSDLDWFINYSPSNTQHRISTPTSMSRSEYISAPCGYVASLSAAAIP